MGGWENIVELSDLHGWIVESDDIEINVDRGQVI